MEGRTVLVVEDELLIRMTLSEALADAGFAVLEAGDGEEALRLLDIGPPLALLVTDLTLPGAIDGAALVARVRLRAPGLPVIVTSGRAEADRPSDPTRVVIPKPYSLAEVCAQAERLTRG